MIARAVNGKKATEYISPQFVGSITKSLEKQRRIEAEIDATDELRKITGRDDISFKYRDFILPLRPIEVRSGKNVVKGYVIKEEPVLLHYAKLTKQCLTVSASLLDVKETATDENGKLISTEVSIANTDGRIAIKGYMLRRVEVMRNDERKARDALYQHNRRREKDATLPAKGIEDFRSMSRTILFETLFAEAGLDTTDRKQIMKNREYAFAVLNYWIAEGYITGYKQQKKTGRGSPITGIEIIC